MAPTRTERGGRAGEARLGRTPAVGARRACAAGSHGEEAEAATDVVPQMWRQKPPHMWQMPLPLLLPPSLSKHVTLLSHD